LAKQDPKDWAIYKCVIKKEGYNTIYLDFSSKKMWVVNNLTTIQNEGGNFHK
jgi:hypothetical protein